MTLSVHLLGLLALSFKYTTFVESFLVESSLCRTFAPHSATPGGGSVSETNTVNEGDDYDDFFKDFNPADFEPYNSNYPVGDSGGRRAHDYTRDLDADDSNVDLDAINALLTERAYKRQIGQFADADRIRDQLLDEHGVMCRDKESMWRSGCSRSGSGQKWLNADLKSRGRSDMSLGPNGHDYKLSSDAGPNTSQLSDDEIHRLLADRLAHKFKRNYKRADEIQANLLSSGVFVSDSNKEWRADGKGFSSYKPSRYKISPHSEEGVDPSTMQEIMALIDERAVAKVERLYGRADDIRKELIDRYNVVVDDRSLTFCVGRADGIEKSRNKAYAAYKLSLGSEVPLDADEIQNLVEQRDVARVDRDFSKADEIRNILSDRNIFIDDKNREWYVGNGDYGGGERIRHPTQQVEREPAPYARTGGGDLSEMDLDSVVKSIRERDIYKQKRQYQEADAIRTKLADVYGVRIDDRNREWHVESNDYCMANDSALIDDETKSVIEQKIRDRSQAREQRNFNAADEIRFDLEEKYKVTIDDRVKEWRI